MPQQEIVKIAHPAQRFAYFKTGDGKYERHQMADVDAMDAVARFPNEWSLAAPEEGEVVDKVAAVIPATVPEPGAAPGAGQITTAPAAGTPAGLQDIPSELAERDAEIALLREEIARRDAADRQRTAVAQAEQESQAADAALDDAKAGNDKKAIAAAQTASDKARERLNATRAADGKQ